MNSRIGAGIFDNPNAEGRYFKTWEGKIDNSVSGNTWYCDPGESFGIIANTTFTALWDEQPYTSASVLWRDGSNKDGLRPADKLTIKVRGSDGSQTPVDVMAAKNWKVSIPGNIKPDDITVDWDRIGEDADDQYACEVLNREGGSGIVIELTHTPQKNIQAKGTVNWVDNDDAGGKRPSNVTVHLLADSRVVDSQTIDAKSGWTWVFGERPAYVDGQEVYYSVDEDPIEGYDTYTKGFDITNVLGGAKVSTEIRGLIRWVDHDNAGNSRPKNVAINLLKDGKQIDKQVVSRDAQGHWIISFEVPGTTDENDYTITEDAVEGYATVIRSAEETGGLWLVTNVLENHEHQRETLSSVVVQPTCKQKGLRRTIECCEECGEIFLNKKEDVSASGHDWDDWYKLIDATEVHAGLETRYCKNDKSHMQTRIIPKTVHDHTLVKVDAKAATCTEDGNIEYWQCAEGKDPCGMCFEDEAATKWIHQEGTVVHATGHDWGTWRITKAPSESEEGEETRTCARCGHAETRTIPTKVVYRYVGPEGQSWTKGGATALEFTFRRSYKDELTFELFTGIQVDGKTVPQKDASDKVNYMVQAGSLVLKLQPSYLGTLAVGSHKVTAAFEDGSASAEFVVKAASSKDEEEETNKEDGNNKASKDDGSSRSGSEVRYPQSSISTTQGSRASLPKTGDPTSMVSIVAVPVGGSLALVGFVVVRKKREVHRVDK